MRVKATLMVGVAATSIAFPAYAQDEPQGTTRAAPEIVVTAQRQAQSLQEVPIAVSAFSAEALEAQQIENASDLQLTLPNVSFTKSNFTSSSFTIRGIGDLCVGVSCDSATAIHLNGSPLFGTRLFETEYSTLSGSKSCAARKAPCSGATPPRAWSTSSPPSLTCPASAQRANSNTATLTASVPRA